MSSAEGITNLWRPIKAFGRKLSLRCSSGISLDNPGENIKKISQPREIEICALRAITRGVRVFSNSVYLPNKITLRLNPQDMAALTPFLSTFLGELSLTIKQHISECMQEVKNSGCRIYIKIEEHPSLKAGQFECQTELVDMDNDTEVG